MGYWGAVYGEEESGHLWCDIIRHRRKPRHHASTLQLRVPGKWKKPRYRYMEVHSFSGGKVITTIPLYQVYQLVDQKVVNIFGAGEAGAVFPLLPDRVERLLKEKGVE